MNNKKVAIIVNSKTGNTFSVAEKLRDKLGKNGVNADLTRFFAEDNEMKYIKNIKDKSLPDASEYDIIVFGAPVNAFSLSWLMSAYLEQQKSLAGKKVLCFVTMAFPKPWLGGNRAIAKMKKLCGKKGVSVNSTGIVNWNHQKRGEMISEITSRFCDEVLREKQQYPAAILLRRRYVFYSLIRQLNFFKCIFIQYKIRNGQLILDLLYFFFV